MPCASGRTDNAKKKISSTVKVAKLLDACKGFDPSERMLWLFLNPKQQRQQCSAQWATAQLAMRQCSSAAAVEGVHPPRY